MKKLLIMLVLVLISCTGKDAARYVPFEEFINMEEISIEKENADLLSNPEEGDDKKDFQKNSNQKFSN
jgi:hypothetical protein